MQFQQLPWGAHPTVRQCLPQGSNFCPMLPPRIRLFGGLAFRELISQLALTSRTRRIQRLTVAIQVWLCKVKVKVMLQCIHKLTYTTRQGIRGSSSRGAAHQWAPLWWNRSTFRTSPAGFHQFWRPTWARFWEGTQWMSRGKQCLPLCRPSPNLVTYIAMFWPAILFASTEIEPHRSELQRQAVGFSGGNGIKDCLNHLASW